MSILIPLLLATLIGLILGTGRRIGFWWVFFFSFFFGLIPGIAMALGSVQNKRLQEEIKPFEGKGSIILGILFLLLSAFSFFASYQKIDHQLYFILWTLSFGFFGAAIYVLRTSNRPYKKSEDYEIKQQVDGLIVLVITCIFLVYMQFEKNNMPFYIKM